MLSDADAAWVATALAPCLKNEHIAADQIVAQTKITTHTHTKISWQT
jgi:hypothetical protein